MKNEDFTSQNIEDLITENASLRAELVASHERIGNMQDEQNSLQDVISKMQDEKLSLGDVISNMESEKLSLAEVISKMQDQIDAMRRVLFGRKSERYINEDPNQLTLDFDGVEQLEEERIVEEALAKEQAQASAEVAPVVELKKSKKVETEKQRRIFSEHLERKDEIVEPEAIPEGSKRIGEEVTELLEYKPGEFYIRRIIRPKYALPNEEGVIIGDLPSLPLPRSNAGSSTLAQLLVGKYQDHLPLHRQMGIFSRSGVHLKASTVSDWVHGAIELLEPLYDTLRKRVLGCDYIQVDESTIPVLDKDKPRATKKGYHWVVRSPELNSLFFHYDKGSRAQRVVVELLKDFKGAVQSDGYGAYNIYENKEGVLLLGCWAHARRKFEQALKNDPARAEYALKVIQRLYVYERDWTEQGLPPDEVSALRKERSYPIIREFERWLVDNHPKVLPSSLIGKAISYTYTIYPRLARYVVDGSYRIDNNLAENAVRPLAVGRKNYLFCRNHDSARRTAIIYSLLGTCKLWGVNPTEWLTDVLNRIQDQSILRLDELLPHKWKEINADNTTNDKRR